jgi:CDP-glycerol glycerophosphotransferase
MRGLDSEGEIPAARTGSAPLLSIVIPVYNLDAYISSCLDTITEQGFRDIEVIAIDARSRDNTWDLLQKRRLDDRRLTLLVADKRGPGYARNLGVAHARGEYLWFVDGDDELASGALTTIADRLWSDRPDVLVINHADLGPDGLAVGQDDTVLARDDTAGCGPLADRPWLLDVRLVMWNKVVSREFYLASGARFLEEWPHEDVPVSCRLLLRAARISVAREVCYHFRRERPGSATKSGDQRRHFAVFAAWQQALAGARRDALAAGPTLPVSLYHRLFERAVWHCSTVLDHRPEGGDPYIADADRKDFFGQLTGLYRAFKLPGYRLPGGFRGAKFALIAARWYRAYNLLDPVNRQRIELLGRARSVFRRRPPGRIAPRS